MIQRLKRHDSDTQFKEIEFSRTVLRESVLIHNLKRWACDTQFKETGF